MRTFQAGIFSFAVLFTAALAAPAATPTANNTLAVPTKESSVEMYELSDELLQLIEELEALPEDDEDDEEEIEEDFIGNMTMIMNKTMNARAEPAHTTFIGSPIGTAVREDLAARAETTHTSLPGAVDSATVEDLNARAEPTPIPGKSVDFTTVEDLSARAEISHTPKPVDFTTVEDAEDSE
ncbi:hypothetical protein K490DRAFT_53195 [Saccharata proteae CBS 121410]|uniref:Uncharacterized protein n=1 Tax=Saccharata proteae CBS 121410 TaxID=1314787 RepID=A0A9P4I1V9_9PEZI|nr:hypothetical protein K490DRAFT_53195 [Saccharata proteae CBS 121410]